MPFSEKCLGFIVDLVTLLLTSTYLMPSEPLSEAWDNFTFKEIV